MIAPPVCSGESKDTRDSGSGVLETRSWVKPATERAMSDPTDARLFATLQAIVDAAGAIPVIVLRRGEAEASPMAASGTHAQTLLALLDVDLGQPDAPHGPAGFSADWIEWAVEKTDLQIVGPPSPPLESVVALGVFLRQESRDAVLVLTEPERASVWHDTLGPGTRMVGLHGDAHSGKVH
jgi:hypothetical protein